MRGNNYYMPEQAAELKKRLHKQKKAEEPVKTVKNLTLDKAKLFILKIILGIIGSISAFLSMYYSYIWFASNMYKFLAIFFSVIMVSFSVCAFEIIIWLRQEKKHLISGFFSFLWIIVLLLSMISTVAGLYNKYWEKKNIKIIQNTDNNYKLLKELENQEQQYKQDIEDKIKERKRFLKILSEFDTNKEIKENKKQINSYRNSLYYLDKDIKKLKEKLNSVIEEKKELLSKNKNVKELNEDDFFTWAEKIIKVKSYVLQFILNIFPAVFIDIIAPLCFALVLFFNRKNI
jgi:hypothetical protein